MKNPLGGVFFKIKKISPSGFGGKKSSKKPRFLQFIFSVKKIGVSGELFFQLKPQNFTGCFAGENSKKPKKDFCYYIWFFGKKIPNTNFLQLIFLLGNFWPGKSSKNPKYFWAFSVWARKKIQTTNFVNYWKVRGAFWKRNKKLKKKHDFWPIGGLGGKIKRAP